MSASFLLLQTEKADRLQVSNNSYVLIQVSGSKVNSIQLFNSLKKQNLNPLKINRVNLPKKTKVRGGRNKVSVKRLPKFIVTLNKGNVIEANKIIEL